MALEKTQPEVGRDVLRAPLTDRINEEPAIINGMSASEANYIGLGSLAVSVAIGSVIYLATGYWVALFLICVVVPMVSLWYGSLYLQKVKRNRPEGYYVQAIHLFFAARDLVRSRFIKHNGYFELGCRSDPNGK